MATTGKNFNQRLAALSEKIEAQHTKSKDALQHAQDALKRSQAAQQHPSISTLNSWKEIALYLDRGVRTVQRWEKELQLPVRRIGSGKRAPVYAIVSELKFWIVTSARTNGLRHREAMPHDSRKGQSAALIVRLNGLVQALAE